MIILKDPNRSCEAETERTEEEDKDQSLHLRGDDSCTPTSSHVNFPR